MSWFAICMSLVTPHLFAVLLIGAVILIPSFWIFSKILSWIFNFLMFFLEPIFDMIGSLFQR